MWAQYAENHRGVCLCFDREKILDSVRCVLGAGECFADNVVYSDEQFEAGPLRPNPEEAKEGGPEYVRIFRERLARHRYLTKRLDWKDEREWRIVVLTHPVPPTGQVWTDGNALVPIDGALRAIVVGHRFSEAYRPVIRDACARLGIPAFKLGYENGRVALSGRYDVTTGPPPTPPGPGGPPACSGRPRAPSRPHGRTSRTGPRRRRP
jgi:hypothetical protein